MDRKIIILLLTAFITAAIGQMIGQEVQNVLRLRNRSRRRRMDLMIDSANISNGKLGVFACLVIP